MIVSILIPAYNAEKYLRDCLESVVRQTYKNIQVVVWDDGSNDSTFSIAQDFSRKDTRIEVYRDKNQGVAVARNCLLSKANGEYTLFVDADDWIEPEMVETMVEMITKTNADVAMCGNVSQNTGVNYYPDKLHRQLSVWNHSEILKKFLYHRELTGALWNKLVRTSLFHEFTPGISYGEDAMVMWQVFLNTDRMVVTQNQYYHYRMNPESVSHSGGISKKISVLKVWRNIIDSIPVDCYYLRPLAKGRFGAEITLILYDAVRNSIPKNNVDVMILRNELKNKLRYMFYERVVSWKFLIFSLVVAYNWNFSKFLCNRF